MTIQNLINKVQAEKPNSFGTAKLIEYINEVEASVANEVNMEIPVYTTEDLDEELLVPAPYDNLYVSYVKAMIDFANEEYGSYQINQMQYAQDNDDFKDWVTRTEQTDDALIPSRFVGIF